MIVPPEIEVLLAMVPEGDERDGYRLLIKIVMLSAVHQVALHLRYIGHIEIGFKVLEFADDFAMQAIQTGTRQ